MPIWCTFDQSDDMRCCLVIKQFEVVGHHLLEDKLRGRPAKRARTVKIEAARVKFFKKETPQECVLGPPAVISSSACKCDGALCSKDGVQFIICLATCIPPQSISLSMVARDCVFATRELTEMSPSDKRFLLYYYYATTVYQFHGAGNRIILPECLKIAVRKLYPNPTLENNN
jgi:hypothetical protein